MKIIISGTVDIDPEKMSAAMTAGKPLIDGALTQDGCLDYDWCPDPTTEGRIRVFERWASQEALSNHFDNHWYTDMRDAIGSFGLRSADVLKYKVELEEPIYDETGTPRADFLTEKKDD